MVINCFSAANSPSTDSIAQQTKKLNEFRNCFIGGGRAGAMLSAVSRPVPKAEKGFSGELENNKQPGAPADRNNLDYRGAAGKNQLENSGKRFAKCFSIGLAGPQPFFAGNR